MLELKHIVKTYDVAGIKTRALDGVDIKFGNKGLVAILGQSGSGKTTALNIIGGLDRYTDGDLIIKGRSTKKFKENDWDAYRNNSIGFIFQSYNLISHLSVLSNVEMSMQLSGVGARERKEKATALLTKVGLKDHLHKKPSQLSGGQAQRVAIARALSNDPEILLCDEPTGALDSATSVQVMELIKELSEERLVIMVTHNAEIADEYSDRIIRFKDGKVIEDRNIASENEDEEESQDEDFSLKKTAVTIFNALKKTETNITKKGLEALDKFIREAEKTDGEDKFVLKRTAMSFPTALKLSGTNILTKKGRIFLTSFASSIGIIAIAIVLSLSNGFQEIIEKFQQNAMGDFPIIVTRQSQTINREDMEEQHNSRENMGAIYGKEVKRDPINDITAYDDSNLTVTHDNLFTDDYVNFLEDISPDILQNIGYSRITQINFIRQTQNNDGNTLYKPFQIMPISMGNMSGGGMSITSMTGAGIVSYPEPHGDGDESYIERYYEVLQGKFPTEPGEAIIYVDNNGRIPLNTLTTLGFDVKDGEKITFDEVLDAKLVVAGNDDYYIKNGQMYSELNSYAQMQTANEMVNNYIASVRTMGVDPAWLGISEEDPVAWFYGLSASENPEEDMASAFENAAKKYGEKLGADIAAGTLVMNPADVPAKVTDTMNKVGTGMEDMQKNFTSDAYQEKVDEKIQELAETAYKADNTVEVKIVGVVALRTDAAMSILSPGIAFPDSFVNEVISNAQESSIVKAQKGNPDVNVLTGKNFNADQSMLDQLTGGSSLDYDTVMQLIGGESKPMIFTLFPLDFESKEKLIKKLDKFNSDTALERYRQDFIDAGVKEEDVPTKAKDFNENFLELLEDNYASLIKNNEDGVIDEEDGKLLQNKQFIEVTQKDGGRWRSPFVTDMYSVVYTDLSGSIMDMTDGIMDTITVVLIGFAGISLVVTLIMIAIITYTSVLERIKEIGVLRALGARKKDIIRVFDAETFWIGAFSGILGIAIAYVLIFPMNIIIENITDVPDVAVLNPIHAVCLFIISTLLTVAGGHIPAMKASKMNAVEALRSE